MRNEMYIETEEKLGFTYLLSERFQFDGQEMESIENILWRK